MMMQLVELGGVVTALLYLLLVTRRSWLCWPFYIISSCFYFPVFWSSHLYADACLQIYFVIMGFYAWVTWKNMGDGAVKIVRWQKKKHVVMISLVLVGSVLVGRWLSLNTEAGHFGYFDAFISIGSVVTTVLTARKVLESWWYWIVIDIVASIIFLLRGLDVTIFLYVVYTVLACRALKAWSAAYEWQEKSSDLSVASG